MATWNPQLTRLRQQLARIALGPGTLNERAAAILGELGQVLPFDAAWLAVRDPELRRHSPLATAGAAEPLRRYFQTPDADDDLELLGLNRQRPPMLASETPIPLPELRGWAEYLLPAGFRGGLASGLFTPEGRHVGFLIFLSEDPSRPGPADREVIAALTGVIAYALDRTRDIASVARIVEAASAGVVLTRGGNTLPLPGLPDHRLLAPGSRLLATAGQELAGSTTAVTFLAVTGDTDDPRLVRVSALDVSRPDLDHLRGAVLLSPPGDLRGLTPLDLRLLGLLVEGATHVPALAAALGVPERTVGDALRAILTALDTSDLTAATVRALRLGLRIPPGLDTPS
ncbi:MAG: helix-turn-helix transcriptional regulator [Blastococcus sp.]